MLAARGSRRAPGRGLAQSQWPGHPGVTVSDNAEVSLHLSGPPAMNGGPPPFTRGRGPGTAFVLTGGASLGALQVGMLGALYERGIRPDVLVGTSAGALN